LSSETAFSEIVLHFRTTRKALHGKFSLIDLAGEFYFCYVISGVKLLGHRWGICSPGLKLDYTFVILTKRFTQT